MREKQLDLENSISLTNHEGKPQKAKVMPIGAASPKMRAQLIFVDGNFWDHVSRVCMAELRVLQGGGMPFRTSKAEPEKYRIDTTDPEAARICFSYLIDSLVGLNDRTNEPVWLDGVKKHNKLKRYRKYQQLDDLGYGKLRSLMWEQFKLSFKSKDILYTAIQEAAEQTIVDPVADYLEEREGKWDGYPRVEHLFPYYFDCIDNSYTRFVSRAFMIGAVARALSREKPSKVDTMPVLKGPQGPAKSTGIIELFGHEFCQEAVPNLRGEKDTLAIMHEAWCIELGELSALRKQGHDETKDFLTRQRDTWRPPYARVKISKNRRFVLWATTNDDTYLSDVTGSRRFWPIDMAGDEVKLGAINLDRDQLWSEAITLYRGVQSSIDAWKNDPTKAEGKMQLPIAQRWWLEPYDGEPFQLWQAAISAKTVDAGDSEIEEVMRAVDALRKLRAGESVSECDLLFRSFLRPWEENMLFNGEATMRMVLNITPATRRESTRGKAAKAIRRSMLLRKWTEHKAKRGGTACRFYKLPEK